MTMMSQSVNGNSRGASLEMTQPTVDSTLQQENPNQRTTPPFEEPHRQELEVKINELRAKCRLQAEQLMAWRKAYAFEVSQRLNLLEFFIVTTDKNSDRLSVIMSIDEGDKRISKDQILSF